ncbi:alanine--tRNA ligase-like [Salvia hispanica]|uniref:alanine--tRNA ligase-like n=1 Tax=Salvia hispanica TaxID=49212 RepID=UPI002009472B|nr:alanine--tRNA ligase-like [Salvia hispanica]
MVKWTEEEDAELVRLVGIHGEKKWALISGLIPPRTRGSVRERWVHNLDPNLNKNPFTQEEDAIIMEEEARGTAWSVMLSRLARGRTDRMVKNRYKNTLVKRRNQPTLEELEASYDTFLAKAAELGRDIALRKAKMAAEAATDVAETAETAADVAETLADAAEGAADADLVLPLPHWPSKEVRAAFIAFFEGKGHANWTVPLVRHDCQTRHFAGMKLYNPIFLGTNDPDTNRACYTQKCIGVSEYTQHHTFYEVLKTGLSGTDYFKEEAIQWAWELLTKVYKLPGEKIYATYFGGDEELGLKDADEEAKKEWLKVLPASRVLPCENNFWKMGDTGPCGPCTEIHFDSIGRPDGASLGNKDEPTVIEIWSLVFIQYNMEAGVLKPLTAKHVGTGMGFERLTSILQNKMSHYDTDIFMPIFDAIQQATKARPYTGKVGADDLGEVDMAYRVVADHIRTISFAIADGSCPGNDGRGYVLRRILQQAVKYGTGVLKAQPYFFSGLVQVVVDVMSDDFPELKEHYIKIRDIIADEEASFGSTFTKVLSLSQGTEKFKKAAQEVQGKTLGEQSLYLVSEPIGGA